MAQVAVCSQINTKHINTVWAERTVVECETVGASRDQYFVVFDFRVLELIRLIPELASQDDPEPVPAIFPLHGLSSCGEL